MGPHVSRMANTTFEDLPEIDSRSESPDITVDLTTNSSDYERQYHGVEDSEYFLPSDTEEQDRLELQHYLLRHLFKGDIVRNDVKELLANPGSKILDVGCANGWWLDSVRKVYPLSEFYGVDLAPAVIETAAKFLPHATFLAGNILNGLPFEDNTFDFVHQRLLILGLPKKQFHLAIRELMRVTKPNGWIELVEGDCKPFRAGPHTKKIYATLWAVMAPRELDFFAGTNLERFIQLAAKDTSMSAEKIEKKTISMRLNWGGPVGDMAGTDFKLGFYHMEDVFHKQLCITREEYRELVDNYIDECKQLKTFLSK